MSRAALTNCSRVLTNVGEDVNGASVLVNSGRIVDVVEGGPPIGFEPIDVGGRVVTPGLVDAHTHAVFAGDRADEFALRGRGATYEEIAESGGGILSTVAKVRELDADQLFIESKSHIEAMLRCGTTTAEVKSGYGLATLQELKMLEVAKRLNLETPMDVVPTFLGAHAVPKEFAGNKSGYMDLVINEMLPLVIDTKSAVAVDMFIEDGYFDTSDAARLMDAIDGTELKLRLHVDQFSKGGAQIAARLGAHTADHLEQTGPDGIEALADAGVIPVLLPASVLLLGLDKYPDARKMLDLGMPVVVATDFNPGSSPTPSLPFAMSLAVGKMGMSYEEAFRGCTLNAARALCRNDVGVVAPGAKADLVVWDTDDLRDVAYLVGADMVYAVYKDGERVV